ncbi:MAG: exodeoxyribonuclease VII small subunit [Halobacteriales archaeon]
MDLTEEETVQLATVVETVLEEGYDLDGVDEEVLEAVREKLPDGDR